MEDDDKSISIIESVGPVAGGSALLVVVVLLIAVVLAVQCISCGKANKPRPGGSQTQSFSNPIYTGIY